LLVKSYIPWYFTAKQEFPVLISGAKNKRPFISGGTEFLGGLYEI